MKRNLTKSVLVILVIGVTYACSSTRNVTMQTLRPADIDLPAEVSNILFVDRTVYKQQGVDILEGVLTGELPGDDRAAVQQALNALRTEIQISPRFNGVVARERLEGNSLTRAFPDPIAEYQIKSLAKKYDCQAVVAIEVFDTDLIVTDGVRKKKITVEENDVKKQVEVDEFYAEGVGNIKMGIRLYNAFTGDVEDEQMINDGGRWNASARSRAEAIAQLISRSQANAQMSRAIGANYAHKIAPLPINISRVFYRKEKQVPAVEVGSRLGDVNRWQEAIETWKRGINNGQKAKYNGYLAHNIAVGYEVLGNYDEAIQWAQDAYAKYGDKKSRAYVSLLYARKASEERVDQQLNK